MSKNILILFCLTGLLVSCSNNMTQYPANDTDQNAVLFTMQKHLDAVSNKDLKSLAETLHPDGQMQLILPSEEIKHSAAAFIEFHKTWFNDPNWTFETKILNSKVGTQLALVVVEIIYREPLRDGKPYFNRLTISYDLEKTDDQWYVIKDHASSVQKSTDK